VNEPAEQLAEGQVYGRSHRTRWIIAVLVLFIVLAGFLLPLINLGRYHRTIADSLTRSLGHTVHLGSVNLAVFPLPGLVIHDFTVEENPSFGAEPLLRAPSVTVYLRLSSLWRQRLEISRIDLDDASVNLVRDQGGRWNFSSLLLQASRTATAPTAQRHPSAAPRFPYIEFSSARINFKQGYVKKDFSFLNADASVWLADPNHWRIRLEGQPARTDLDPDLEDTGTMRLDGSLTRATSLDQLPLDLHAEWTGAQLGQVSRLIIGSDSGWRGDLRAEVDLTGDMHNLTLRSRLRVADAHHLEFTPVNPLDIDARCNASYHHPQESIDNLTCLWPTGDGHLLLTGSVLDIAHPRPNLSLEINHTPVAFVVSVLGMVRRGLPQLLDASGTINGRFWLAPQTIRAKGKAAITPPATLTGHAIADTVTVRLNGMDNPVAFAALRLVAPAATANPAINPSARNGVPQVSILRRGRVAPVPNAIQLEPAAFDAGAPTPMQLSGQFSRSGFSLHFTGESSLAQLQPVAQNLPQLRAFAALAPKGAAQSDVTLTGPWILPVTATTSVTMQGWTRLQNAQLKPSWLPEPIEITTATAQFGGGIVTWANASVSVNGIAAKGSVTYPAICDDPAGCPARINLDFPALDAAALQSAFLGAGRHGEFLQAILSRVESPAPPWPALNGTIHAGTLAIANLKLNNAIAAVQVRDRHLDIVSLNAATLGGSAHITGSVTTSSDGPQYALNLTWTGIKLTEAAGLFHEKWGAGSADGQARLDLHGYSDIAATATGDFRWTIKGNWGGVWTTTTPPYAVSPGPTPGPLFVDASSVLTSKIRSRWTATGTISSQTLVLTKGPAQGTIGFDRELDLDWTRASNDDAPIPLQDSASPLRPLHVTGTLAHPVVTAAKAPSTPQTR
jgi:hypothetical protein